MRAQEFDRLAAMMHPEALDQLSRTFGAIAAADSSGEVLGQIFGTRSLAEFRALTPADVFARLNRSLIQSPEMQQAFTSMDVTFVGSVPEPPDMAHVVYRMRMTVEGVTVGKTEVLSFKRLGSEWRALLTGDLEGMIQALSKLPQLN